ncbi:MAG: ester cyclase [Flavobacteriales bacterium]
MTNKEIAKAWFANIDKKDFSAVRSLMHADHKFHNPMTPEAVGPDEHIGMMTMMTGSFEGEHKVELVLEDATHAIVRGRWVGKHTGEFNGISATGNDVNFTFIDIFEIVDGKVRKEAFEMNGMAMMAQLGAVPAHA